MNNLKIYYQDAVLPKFKKEFTYSNIHEIPKLEKIHLSSGLGLKAQNKAFLQKAIDEMRLVSGQQPIITYAKQSIAGFKLREGVPIGLSVTLRREKMYAFLEKLIKLVLPRLRDFRGLSSNQFDKAGNYNLGISDQLVFPEIDFDLVDARRGINISIVTTAKNQSEALFLLKEMGFPFSIL
jgi:large subunit ribosomal protein L5